MDDEGFFPPETRVVPSVSFEFGFPPEWENYTWSCNGIGCLHALLVLLYGWLPDIMPVQLCLIITAITFARKQMDFSGENRFWGWIILNGAAFRELRSSTCLSSEKIFCEMNKCTPPPKKQQQQQCMSEFKKDSSNVLYWLEGVEKRWTTPHCYNSEIPFSHLISDPHPLTSTVNNAEKCKKSSSRKLPH